MSATNPHYLVPRQSVAGEENEYFKMFDPRPTGGAVSIPGYVNQPEPLLPNDPVPEVMGAVIEPGQSSPIADPTPSPAHSHQHQLLVGVTIPKWDSPAGGDPNLHFFTIEDAIIKNGAGVGGQYPACTVRVPRGVVYHSQMHGKGPPPHTIHWHGIEPTPLNDGVGHCSAEFGSTIYQWQPNFIGSYFYHCHRNTMQHFEFGLFGFLIIEPPDAYFASVVNSDWTTQSIPTAPVTLNSIPVGACTDGKFRTAANLEDYNKSVSAAKRFDFKKGDPVWGVAGPNDGPVVDPHAYTVAYDVEALWVMDDRDSTWSDIANNAFDTFPQGGGTPGSDDNFHNNDNAFFAFNDFNADYWFVTSLPVTAKRGGTANINPGFVIPPSMNSGKSGMQVPVQASKNQTILLRVICAAYNKIRITYDMDIVIIAWDGRALGVPPFGLYNHAYVVPAGTPVTTSTARRYDALIKATQSGSFKAKCEFLDTRGGDVLVTVNIPIIVS